MCTTQVCNTWESLPLAFPFISTLIMKIKYGLKGETLADIHAQTQSVSAIFCLYYGGKSIELSGVDLHLAFSICFLFFLKHLKIEEHHKHFTIQKLLVKFEESTIAIQ